jgi:alkylated DNA repair dioxygenase AlkB
MLQSMHVKPAGIKSMAGQTIGSVELERVDLDEHTYVLRGQLAGAHADRLLDHIAQTARWRQEYINCYGRKAQPRLTTWFGLGFSAESRYRVPLDAQEWTAELVTLRDELGQVVNTSFNALLVNRYRSGRDYVSWHSDDERRLGVDPLIASVSLGTTRKFSLRRKVDGLRVDFELRHGDVLIMAGRCQTEWEHTLTKTTHAGERFNLTLRRYELP